MTTTTTTRSTRLALLTQLSLLAALLALPAQTRLGAADRLARNRADDVQIQLIEWAGARLVSVTENVDDTACGRLVRSIMADVADFYSANLASWATARAPTRRRPPRPARERSALAPKRRRRASSARQVTWSRSARAGSHRRPNAGTA